MYLIKKSAKNLLKNKGRNSIMLLMLSIVTTASLSALTIFNVTSKMGKETKNYYAGEVTIVANSDMSEDGSVFSLDIDDYRRFADSDLLRSYAIFKGVPVELLELDLIDGEYAEESNGNIIKANARVYGMLDENSRDDFTYGERKIIEGSFPLDITGCMVSDALAALNNLNIGDEISFVSGPQKNLITLVITGIFSDGSIERRQTNHRSPALNTRNDIIVPIALLDGYPDGMDSAMSFLLKNPDDLEAFQNELYEKGLPYDLYTVQYDNDRYTEASVEIQKMSSLVSALMGIVAFIGISIVFLLNLFALRERKYEIGVLRAIGMPNLKVMVLLLGEMLLLALIGVVVAVAAGAFINPYVVNFMMRLEMNHELPSALKMAAQNINSSFSPFVILELFALTITLVFLAGSMTILNIVRFDAAKILSERS